MARVSYRVSPPRPSSQRRLPRMEPMKVWVLVLITMVTNGIYIPIWYLQRLEFFNHLDSKKKLSRRLLLFSTVISVSATLTPFVMALLPIVFNSSDLMATHETMMLTVTVIFMFFYVCAIVTGIYLVVVAFQTRRILMDHFDISLSIIWTFLFNIYYLQYHCNRLDFSEDVLSQRSVFE